MPTHTKTTKTRIASLSTLVAIVISVSLPSHAAALGTDTRLTDNIFAPAYVAFGDSLTTGSSISTCLDDRAASPWGCRESPTAAVPYPNLVAQALQLTYSDNLRDYRYGGATNQLGLYRAGIWGYTVQEAARADKRGRNEAGNWMPQLQALKQARQLVTGALGINDIQFSNVAKWARLYLKPGGDHITPEVGSIIHARRKDFDALFGALRSAQENGAKVIMTAYYNPYDSDVMGCAPLKEIGNRIVDSLNTELIDRSHQSGFSVADLRSVFGGHGAGSPEPYVFGTDCKIDAVVRTWAWSLIKGLDTHKSIAVKFDPHPNSNGTAVIANTILQEYNNAD